MDDSSWGPAGGDRGALRSINRIASLRQAYAPSASGFPDMRARPPAPAWVTRLFGLTYVIGRVKHCRNFIRLFDRARL